MSPSLYIPGRTAHALYILSIHTSKDLKPRIKMLNVSGPWSLVTGWNLTYLKGRTDSETRRRRTTSFLGFGARALHRHGTEEIYIGHRARAQELRSCVGNGVDNGQRWASSTKNNKIKGNKDKNGKCVAGNVQLWSQLFFSVCFAVRMPSQHLEFKWLKRDSQKVWDGINSAALVLKSVLRPLCANRG